MDVKVLSRVNGDALLILMLMATIADLFMAETNGIRLVIDLSAVP